MKAKPGSRAEFEIRGNEAGEATRRDIKSNKSSRTQRTPHSRQPPPKPNSKPAQAAVCMSAAVRCWRRGYPQPQKPTTKTDALARWLRLALLIRAGCAGKRDPSQILTGSSYLPLSAVQRRAWCFFQHQAHTCSTRPNFSNHRPYPEDGFYPSILKSNRGKPKSNRWRAKFSRPFRILAE